MCVLFIIHNSKAWSCFTGSFYMLSIHLLLQTYNFLSGKEKDASHISVTRAFLQYFQHMFIKISDIIFKKQDKYTPPQLLPHPLYQ